MRTSNQTSAPLVRRIRDGAPDEIAAPQMNGRPPAVLLACGNSLREDDGVGLRIAEIAQKAIAGTQLRVIATHQWTPELAVELVDAELVIFVDANAADEPGVVRMVSIEAHEEPMETHGVDPATVLGLAVTLSGHAPEHAVLLTIGADWFGYGEQMSRAVCDAVPKAVRLVEILVAALIVEKTEKHPPLSASQPDHSMVPAWSDPP